MRVAYWCLIGMILITACEENLSPEAFVRNRTGQAIDVYHVVEGEEQLVVSLDEPLSASFDQGIFTTSQVGSGCTTGDLVARTPDGAEVARLTEQLCINQGWEIEADGSPAYFHSPDPLVGWSGTHWSSHVEPETYVAIRGLAHSADEAFSRTSN